ncbi:MAG: Cof-type HAD-IIB family hydrolase [bacterium]|nr:Cof-type HAD-IIB family hydrolase [bacterium]
MIRLIASDLDGTLLAPSGQLSPRAIAAIEAAASAGIRVVAATGRTYRSAEHRLRSAPQIQTMVCSNGALVYDLHRNRVDRVRPISGDQLRETFAFLRSRIPELRFGWETAGGFGLEPDFGTKPGDAAYDSSLIGGPQRVEDIDEAVKAFIAHPEVEQVDLQRLVGPELPASMNGATSGARFIEVTAAGVDKGTTVAALAAEWGFERGEVLALGDQMNDEPLLRWAGVSVAMGNARAEVKEIAASVTAPCAEDGAAQVIEAAAAGAF